MKKSTGESRYHRAIAATEAVARAFNGTNNCFDSSLVLRDVLRKQGMPGDVIAVTVNGNDHCVVLCRDLVCDPTSSQFGLGLFNVVSYHDVGEDRWLISDNDYATRIQELKETDSYEAVDNGWISRKAYREFGLGNRRARNLMKKNSHPTLTHPHYGAVENITPVNSEGKRQRVSESGHTIVDVRLPNGDRRTLLLSSFAPQPPPSVAVVETPATMAA